MQSADSQELPKTEAAPVQTSIIGSTHTAIPDIKDDDYPHPLLPTEPMIEDTLSPPPADSIATERPSEQASLGQQVRYLSAIARQESGSQRLGPR